MTEAPGGPGVQVLRAATREAHARLDALVDLRSWNRATHEWWLQRMLGLHEPLEHELGVWRTAWATPDRPHTPDVAVRRRAGAITSWRETKNLLDELTGEELDRAVRAAVELFAVFEAWLRTPVPAR